jgi:nucleoside-diphosphate kinase
MDQRVIDSTLSDAHYAEHVDGRLPSAEFMRLAMVLAGDSAVDVVRVMNGATDARKAEPGTVRGDLALSTSENLVHASDSAESAVREIDLWFPALA